VHGDESVTDGFFKGFSGTLVIDEDFSRTYIDVEIPVATISTFNKTRDKNIRKDDIFFDEAKFPKLRYEVKNIGVENEHYIAEGQFIMKGINAPVKTNFIFVAKGTLEGREVLILEGSGAINRTQFGQSSDASIGDEVTFTFKAIFGIE
jgi:polyisoprenoid-binding protein YceI